MCSSPVKQEEKGNICMGKPIKTFRPRRKKSMQDFKDDMDRRKLQHAKRYYHAAVATTVVVIVVDVGCWYDGGIVLYGTQNRKFFAYSHKLYTISFFSSHKQQ